MKRELALVGLTLCGGCEIAPIAQEPVMPAVLETIDSNQTLAPEINTARSAAMQVATLPPIDDVHTRMEIQLCASMFRAAYESNVGDGTSHFLLEVGGMSDSQELSLNEREYRLRVLAEMSILPARFAWASAPYRGSSGDEFFPGSRQLATRLRFRIIERLESQATVIGEISDFTPHIGSSRQKVTATWEGRKWNIERGGVHVIW